jgi:hypothetical protein
MGIHKKRTKKNIDHYLWPGLMWGAFSIDKEGQQHFVPRTGVPNFQSLGLSKNGGYEMRINNIIYMIISGKHVKIFFCVLAFPHPQRKKSR